jgi:hypothetical protein
LSEPEIDVSNIMNPKLIFTVKRIEGEDTHDLVWQKNASGEFCIERNLIVELQTIGEIGMWT